MSGVDPAAARLAMNAVRGIPRDREGPVFREPWEAQAFAMALALQARGLFSWSEWASALGEEIKRAQAAGDPDTGETYYQHWLATLERMVAEKGLSDPATLTTGDAASNVGYLLRSWLTIQKRKEVKRYVVDGINPP